ncbi:MAG TPA: peptidylprolyl isomerase [Gaiellaceae bacterium]|nr:peptidylprolyl isomerase [Gaiellaceae bacterium]
MRALAIVLAVLSLAAAGCGVGDESATPTATGPAETGAGTGATTPGCDDVPAPESRAEGARTAPDTTLDGQTYRAVVTTNCGTFTITLDQQASPKAVASFVALAEARFFDETVFHRIVPGFVIQGGDPTATGTGGPGYSTVDEPASSTTYTFGTVAMAKAPTEPAGTAGSQFFVVTADDAGLPPDYAVIGTVTDGVDVVSRIGTLGDPQTEQPTQPVVIESIAIERSG